MWIYHQKSGELEQRSEDIKFTGYAGRNEGKNNPAMQNVKGIGPLPCGYYTMVEPCDHPVVGRYAVQLFPAASNEMFGRSSFYMHGDSSEHPGLASHGCIVAPPAARRFVWNSGDHLLQVVSE